MRLVEELSENYDGTSGIDAVEGSPLYELLSALSETHWGDFFEMYTSTPGLTAFRLDRYHTINERRFMDTMWGLFELRNAGGVPGLSVVTLDEMFRSMRLDLP